MIGTFQALFVLVLAILPGGLYTIAREHRGAAWVKSDATSQIIRFVGVSAAFHALFAPLTYFAYTHLIATQAVTRGQKLSFWWWIALLAYLAIPYVLGEVTARSRGWSGTNLSRAKRAVRWIIALYTASSPEPRAWDAVFSRPGLTGWVRLRMQDGSWKAGPWSGAYASGYPEEKDLYMPDQAKLDTDGNFVLDSGGVPELLGIGLLIGMSEIRYLEFVEG